jgi:hypothetical protein
MDELENLLNNYSKPEHTLSLPKQLMLAHFKNSINFASKEQLKELCIQCYENMLVREEITSELIKHKWGLDPISKEA